MHYDLHHIVSHIADSKGIRIIPKNTEKFLAMHLSQNLIFIDSLSFLPGSLASLTRNLLSKENSSLSKFLNYITTDKNHQKLLHRKGVFPYDYLDHMCKLFERKLPPHKKSASICLPDHREYFQGCLFSKLFWS